MIEPPVLALRTVNLVAVNHDFSKRAGRELTSWSEADDIRAMADDLGGTDSTTRSRHAGEGIPICSSPPPRRLAFHRMHEERILTVYEGGEVHHPERQPWRITYTGQ